MGLDCYVCAFKNGEATYDVSDELVELIYDECSGLVGLFRPDTSSYESYKHISFRGKKYNSTILSLTGRDLYSNLSPSSLKKMYETLNEFIKNYDTDWVGNEFETIDNLFKEHEDAIFNYVCKLTHVSIVSPSDIRKLAKLFKICGENNLGLVASY
jgi:hypothetical protein